MRCAARARERSSSKAVGALGALAGVLELDLDVEVARVLRVGRARDAALDLLALADGDGLLEVEDGLLPVRVLGEGARRERERLVQLRERALEVRDERVDVVVARGGQAEGRAERQGRAQLAPDRAHARDRPLQQYRGYRR